jgi:formyltetrahydrofolate deformylase
LRVVCPDLPGIIASVTKLLYSHGGNITDLRQYTDVLGKVFFMRCEWTTATFDLERSAFCAEFSPIASKYDMWWRLGHSCQPPSLAVFASKEMHCLAGVLGAYESGDLECRLPIIIGSHTDGERLARQHGVPFVLLTGTDAEVEATQVELLAEHDIDLVVLARYTESLSPALIDGYSTRVIGVSSWGRHSRTDAPRLEEVLEHGARLIAATSYYVGASANDRMTIEDDVVRVFHDDNIESLTGKSHELDCQVLNRAVQWHIDDRVLIDGERTLVFR